MTFWAQTNTVVHTLHSSKLCRIIAVGQVIRINDERVRLTQQETAFLLFLVAGNGTVRTKSMLFAELYPGSTNVDVKIFDVLACKIRQKFKRQSASAAKLLRTVWGRGYAWGEPERNSISLSERFPPVGIRWTPARKAIILDALMQSKISASEVLDCYTDLSAEELLEWKAGYHTGHRGLRTTTISARNLFRNAA